MLIFLLHLVLWFDLLPLNQTSLFYNSKNREVKLKEIGDLTQVAPTILEYMDIAIPKEMKETESLIIK